MRDVAGRKTLQVTGARRCVFIAILHEFIHVRAAAVRNLL